jgi:hemerythrin-like domain-containing protein
LNDDGSASMATAVMMSHHAFRRDIARFASALQRVAQGDTSRVAALREEWQNFRGALHGHHEAEDQRLFPHLLSQEASLGPVVERLSAEHQRIDPLLERGDHAFSSLSEAAAVEAAQVLSELGELLDQHLAFEEAQAIPHLRGAREFPPPANEAEAELYAQGFAWSTQGIAAEVLAQVHRMLPEILMSRLPAARVAFNERCERVWGSFEVGATRTSLPERI